MIIKIELNYPQEQIEFFAQSRNKPGDENINDFAVRCLTELLTDQIVAPFIDNVQKQRRAEEAEMLQGMRSNAQAGINITVEDVV